MTRADFSLLVLKATPRRRPRERCRTLSGPVFAALLAGCAAHPANEIAALPSVPSPETEGLLKVMKPERCVMADVCFTGADGLPVFWVKGASIHSAAVTALQNDYRRWITHYTSGRVPVPQGVAILSHEERGMHPRDRGWRGGPSRQRASAFSETLVIPSALPVSGRTTADSLMIPFYMSAMRVQSSFNAFAEYCTDASVSCAGVSLNDLAAIASSPTPAGRAGAGFDWRSASSHFQYWAYQIGKAAEESFVLERLLSEILREAGVKDFDDGDVKLYFLSGAWEKEIKDAETRLRDHLAVAEQLALTGSAQ